MGTYAESLLTPDEKVLRRERQHPVALILDSWVAIILWTATIIGFILLVILPSGEDMAYGGDFLGDDGVAGDGLKLVILITLVAGIVVLAWRWWWWRTQEFLVTNRRLVLAWGVLSKSASDSSLEKINDAQLEISVMGRILDYGHLKVLTAAPLQGADYLDRLNHAKGFKKVMMTAKHDLQSQEWGDGEGYTHPQHQPQATPAPAPATSSRIDVSGGEDPLKADTPDEVAAVLNELTKLRDSGSITEAEYDEKKQELLGRL